MQANENESNDNRTEGMTFLDLQVIEVPIASWRGVTAPSKEGVMLLSFNLKAGGVIRLAVDFDGAVQLADAVKFYSGRPQAGLSKIFDFANPR